MHIKGAPEVLLAGCDRIHATGGAALISDADRTAITTALARFQSRGMRTLGFAYRLPITDRREFTRQAVFGPDFGRTR